MKTTNRPILTTMGKQTWTKVPRTERTGDMHLIADCIDEITAKRLARLFNICADGLPELYKAIRHLRSTNSEHSIPLTNLYVDLRDTLSNIIDVEFTDADYYEQKEFKP